MGEFDEGRGFVKLFRKIDKWGWYTDSNTFHLFCHILLHVNYRAAEWKGIKVPAGAMITSSAKLAEQLGMSRQAIRTALDHLKASGEITTTATNRYTLIKVVKWREYQGEATNKTTNKQPTSNQQATTNKKEKNDKNNIYTYARAREKSDYSKLMN